MWVQDLPSWAHSVSCLASTYACVDGSFLKVKGLHRYVHTQRLHPDIHSWHGIPSKITFLSLECAVPRPCLYMTRGTFTNRTTHFNLTYLPNQTGHLLHNLLATQALHISVSNLTLMQMVSVLPLVISTATFESGHGQRSWTRKKIATYTPSLNGTRTTVSFSLTWAHTQMLSGVYSFVPTTSIHWWVWAAHVIGIRNQRSVQAQFHLIGMQKFGIGLPKNIVLANKQNNDIGS